MNDKRMLRVSIIEYIEYNLKEPEALVKAQVAKALERKLITLPRLWLSLRLSMLTKCEVYAQSHAK